MSPVRLPPKELLGATSHSLNCIVFRCAARSLKVNRADVTRYVAPGFTVAIANKDSDAADRTEHRVAECGPHPCRPYIPVREDDRAERERPGTGLGSGTVQRSISSSSVKSSCARDSPAPTMFWRRCAVDDVPGMSRMFGDRCSSQASATDIGVAPDRVATAESAED